MCGAAWAGLFADPGNRVASWKFDATRLEAE
jgi:hypothetical protein